MADLSGVVGYAQSKLGDPYVWGATGPNSFDCSGLVYAAYKAAGIPIPRTTAADYGKSGTAVDPASAVPGDVVYFNEPGATDHVGVYIGGGQMIDAPHTGANVEVDPITGFTSIRDLTAGSGTTTTGGGLAVQNVGSGVLGLPSVDDIGRLVMKAGAGLVAAALVVIGIKESVRSSS